MHKLIRLKFSSLSLAVADANANLVPAGRRTKTIKAFLLAASSAGLLGSSLMAAPAFAQNPDAELEEVTITGSRIRQVSGMETPNPVTVVTMQEISLTAPGSLGDSLAELPQFGGTIGNGSSTTAAPGNFFNNNSTGALSLRGLQSKRTLSLLNGRRVVGSSITGGPDINLFPTSMVRSVETVTGGATAAYGTDAVSGVVNFILDTNFEGVKGSAQTGQNYNADNRNFTISMSGGWKLSAKSHLLLSVEKQHQDAVRGRDDYDWYKGTGLLRNPSPDAGKTQDNPLNIAYDNIVSRTASYDSVINFPAASNLGVWEVNPQGVATPFVLSDTFDTNFQSISNGGSGTDNGADLPELQPETGRKNFFGYVDYDITENLTVYGQLIYGQLDTKSRGNRGLFAGINNAPPRYFQIQSGNPFLPANIQQLMTANNIASVNVGRVGHSEDLAIGTNSNNTEMTSVTTGFNLAIDHDGFFNGWAVDGYMQKGFNTSNSAQDNGIRIDRVYLAADAVRDSSGNTVCNVTKVSGQYPDCQPLNIFGRGQASSAAVDWVTG